MLLYTLSIKIGHLGILLLWRSIGTHLWFISHYYSTGPSRYPVMVYLGILHVLILHPIGTPLKYRRERGDMIELYKSLYTTHAI